MPKISVIVPVYNVEDYLPKCLDSVLAQDFEDYEIIIVDDETPDGSGEIAEEYAKEFPDKITVIHQENKGLGGARNTGIETAKGEYLVFVDSDDTIAPDMLSVMYGEIESTGAEIAVCGIMCVTETGNQWEEWLGEFPLHKLLTIDNYEELLIMPPSACNKMFKTSLFIDSGIRFPSKVWYEDLRTTVKLAAECKGVVFTDECLYYYCLRDGSIIRNSNLDRNSEIIDAMDDLISYFKSKDLFDRYYKEFEFMVLIHVFWEASVRILHATHKHRLLNEFYEYTKTNFPNAFDNEYIIPYINEKKRARTLVFNCLKKKRYRTLNMIFKIKNR